MQTCTDHLIRASIRSVSCGDLNAFARALKPIYTAIDEIADHWGAKNPFAVATWTNAWERWVAFPGFWPARATGLIYTTNSIESLNYQLRKIIKNRRQRPSDDAAIKLLRARRPQPRGQARPRTHQAVPPRQEAPISTTSGRRSPGAQLEDKQRTPPGPTPTASSTTSANPN